jgi:hypothetical protein
MSTLLLVPAHHTPHSSDPPNAIEFYSALGQFMVAWGRFEGHFNGALLQILSLPESASLSRVTLPRTWPERAGLWTEAFNTLPRLQPLQPSAFAFKIRVMGEVEDRHIGAHAVWDEFVLSAPEPTMRAKTIKARKGSPKITDVTNYEISLSLVRQALAEANKLNFELATFTSFLGSLRPPPPRLHTV